MFKLLKIEGLKQFNDYYEEFTSYTNPEYEERNQKSPTKMKYIEYKNYIANGLMNALQRDLNFVKHGVTVIYHS